MTSSKLLRAVHTDTGFRTAWLMVSELAGLTSCWLFFLEYHARESVSDTRSEYRWVETSSSSGVGGAGPQTADIEQWRRRLNVRDSCVKAQWDYSDQHLRWIYYFGLSVE